MITKEDIVKRIGQKDLTICRYRECKEYEWNYYQSDVTEDPYILLSEDKVVVGLKIQHLEYDDEVTIEIDSIEKLDAFLLLVGWPLVENS